MGGPRGLTTALPWGGVYRRALMTPGALAFFLAAAPARLGLAMTGLGLVFLVHDLTGSFGRAGLVTGAFAITEAVMGPQSARLIDRYGQTRVVPFLLVAHGAAIAGLLAGGPMLPLAVLAGATIPQVGARAASGRRRAARRRRRAGPGRARLARLRRRRHRQRRARNGVRGVAGVGHRVRHRP
jgi:MFS family permease